MKFIIVKPLQPSVKLDSKKACFFRKRRNTKAFDFCQSGKMNVALVVSTKAREVEMKFITIHSLELYIRKVFIKIPTVYNLYCGLIVF